MSFADELVVDDTYQLMTGTEQVSLIVQLTADGAKFVVAGQSPEGTEGHVIHLDCCLTLMTPDSATCEALVLVEVVDGGVEAIYLLPLAPIDPRVDYKLVGIDRHAATTRFAEAACIAFGRGTHITMAGGEQRPIEQLVLGDKVLTRDDGPRPIRWVGQRTVRATGEFAPVMIRKGALHNENDLTLSPDSRIFVWQRQDRLGVGRSELLVKARLLVNGESVIRLEGGFIEYFQLLLDDHQIIFAEGIAAESLLIDPRTRTALPKQVREDLIGDAPGHKRRPHQDYEVAEILLSKPDAVELLRRATVS